MDPGQIVLAPFLYSDLRGSKRRPACVLSAETFNEGPDVIVAMVTSSQGRLARADIGDVVIGEWRAAGLLRPSLIRTGRVLVLERRLLSLPLGKLTTSDLAEVIRGLRTVFGLD